MIQCDSSSKFVQYKECFHIHIVEAFALISITFKKSSVPAFFERYYIHVRISRGIRYLQCSYLRRKAFTYQSLPIRPSA